MGSRIRTLIVEDEVGLWPGYEMLLGSRFKLSFCRNAEEAIQTLKAGGYHCILTDFHLGGGQNALDILKRAPAIPTIVVTGDLDPEIERMVAEAGANGFVDKFRMGQKLFAAISAALTPNPRLLAVELAKARIAVDAS